jgi:hypothetical protein
MTIWRAIAGKRNNGDYGCFVSPPGIDAYTAADGSLILTINAKVSQLLLLGQVSSSQTVALGLGKNPFIFLTSQNPFSDGGVTNLSGPVRPSPCATVVSGPALSRGNLASAVINSSGASLSISTGVKTFFSVFNKAF